MDYLSYARRRAEGRAARPLRPFRLANIPARPGLPGQRSTPRPFLVDVLDQSVERSKGPVANADLLAYLEGNRGFRPLDPFLHLVHDARRLVLADRRRPDAAAAEKPGDLGGVLDQMPSLVAQIHLDQHIAGKKLALRADLGAALDLDDLLGRHQDLLEPVRQALLLGLLADR